jgi:hypothetical protein
MEFRAGLQLLLADADHQCRIVFEIRGNNILMRLGNEDDHLR